MRTDPPKISTRIRQRAQGRRTIPELAIQSGMTPSTLYRRLNTGNFRIDEIDRIARTLHCTPTDLTN